MLIACITDLLLC